MKLRAAFDIGSGATKLQVSRVNVETSVIEQTLLSEEVSVLLGVDFEKSGDGYLGHPISDTLLEAIKTLKNKAEKIGVAEYVAIATHVFRRAKNGPEILQRIKETIGVEVLMISQEVEGELGFLTAVAVSGKEKNCVIGWDSGGASFQIVLMVEEKIHVYEGPFGSSTAARYLVENVQKKSFKEVPSPNPVLLEDAQALVELLEQSITVPPPWLTSKLQEQGTVVAIGGESAVFKLAKDLLNKSKITREDIKQTISMTINKTDQQLAHLLQKELVVPKLCSVLAVMNKLGMEDFEYYYSTGSTPGLLIANQFW